MSGTRTTPAGLDTMTPEDTALMDAMRGDTDAPVDAIEREAPVATEGPEVDLADLDADADPADTTEKRSRTVPHEQFHAVNERRKAAEAKVAAEATKHAADMARVQERLNLLMQAVEAGTKAPEATAAAVEIPDVAVDPVGHFQARLEQTQRTVQEYAAVVKGMQEQGQQTQAVMQLRNWAVGQELSFEAAKPDYREAMDFLKAGRLAELEAAGVADPAQREQIIQGDVTQIAMRAQQEGVNFAERLYNIATKRGYAVKAAPPPAPVAAPELPALDVDEPLPEAVVRAQRGRESAISIGSAGAAPPAALSSERLANMSEAEFARVTSALAKKNPAAFRNLMGA